MVAGRIAREYLAQVFAFAVTMADRVLLTGLMIHIWGVDGFAAWTVALSVAGMVALSDFGLGIYFGNRLFFAVEQNDAARARHLLGTGNLLLGLASLGGAVAVVILWLALHQGTQGIGDANTLLLTVAVLTLATALRQAVAVQLAVYRAHREFSRQTWAMTLGEAGRIAVLTVALLAGKDLLIAATLYLATTIAFSVAAPLADLARRHPVYRWRTEAPALAEQREAFVTSGQYWVQSSVSTLFTFAPAFLLAAFGAGAFAIAQFALMRTLANLARAILQLFTNVFGLEVARRIAIADTAGASATYRESTRFLAVQTAAASGALWAIAAPLFTLWTGDPLLYDNWLFWLAIGAPVVLPSLSMAVQVLVCANWPRPLAVGRLAQLALSVGLYFVMPFESPALRMMAALALGEVFGLGLPVVIAVAQRIGGAGLALHLELALRSVAAGAIAWGGATAGMMAGGMPGLILGCIGGGAGMAAAMLLLGLSGDRTAMLWAAVRARQTDR
jgi:O-antigen/teichoic acid export membrane protein